MTGAFDEIDVLMRGLAQHQCANGPNESDNRNYDTRTDRGRAIIE
jgi:hypothetical protein